MKLLLYCTKSKPYLVYGCINKYILSYGYDTTYSEEIKNNLDCFNGKIVAECDFEVSKIELHQCYYNYGPAYFTKRKTPFRYFSYTDLLSASCMQDNEMLKYLGNKGGYAIHIKNLHIFDEPRKLSDYYSYNINGKPNTPAKSVRKAPQNMMKVFEWSGDDYILISIRPEWLCKILNGEKTIEIRKKVLKEML